MQQTLISTQIMETLTLVVRFLLLDKIHATKSTAQNLYINNSYYLSKRE